jgi:undecaprenyl-diphosphatase
MLAATGYDLFKHGLTFNPGEASFLMVGIAVSFLVSLAAIKWLLSFVRRHNFTGFGIYRIVVGLGWILIFWLV